MEDRRGGPWAHPDSAFKMDAGEEPLTPGPSPIPSLPAGRGESILQITAAQALPEHVPALPGEGPF